METIKAPTELTQQRPSPLIPGVSEEQMKEAFQEALDSISGPSHAVYEAVARLMELVSVRQSSFRRLVRWIRNFASKPLHYLTCPMCCPMKRKIKRSNEPHTAMGAFSPGVGDFTTVKSAVDEVVSI